MSMTTTTAAASAARRRRVHGIWLASYAITILIVIGAVLQVRKTTLRDMATPEAQAQWQEWREAEPNQAGGPVRRRPPSTVEPPALVLMRDHFTVVICGSVLFSSLLFAAIMMAARGVFATDDKKSHNG
jgi:hypothetical protein